MGPEATDEEWPPPWAATIRAQTNPALARPQRRADVDCTEVIERGVTRWVLRRRATSRYLRIGELERDAWERFDGATSVLDVAKALSRLHSTLALPAVESFAATLDALGLVEGSPGDLVYGPLHSHVRHQHLKGRLLWLRETLIQRRIAVAGLGPAIDATYRRLGRYFYARISLLLLAIVTGAGCVAFFDLGMPNPATTARRDLVLGGLLTIGCIAFHELAHAWTVRHFGRDVCRAGVFLKYGMPGAFVDTTDMWLAPRRQRLWVTAAGPITNAVIGGGASLLALAQPSQRGFWQVVAAGNFGFVVANLMPLLKLDGYYLVMDALGVADLRERGTAFVFTSLVSRVRASWQRGDLLPRFERDERVLAVYGVASIGWLIFVALSGLLVLPHRLERIVMQARRGELHGAPLLIMGSFTTLTVTLLLLGFIANRADMALALARIGRRVVQLRGVALLAVHLGGAFALAWLVPALAAHRNADAGEEWQRAVLAIAGVVIVATSRRLRSWTSGQSWTVLFCALMICGASLVLAAVAPHVEVARQVTAGLLLAAAGVTLPRWARTLSGSVGGAWLLILAGSIAVATGVSAAARPGACAIAGGTVLAWLLWHHIPNRRAGVLDKPADERPDDRRDGAHLGRAVVSIAERVLADAVAALGTAERPVLVTELNRRLAGRAPVWFTADGRVTDRVAGMLADRVAAYDVVLAALRSTCTARLGAAFAEDTLAAAGLDLPRRLRALARARLSITPSLDRPRALATRHLVEQPLHAAGVVFGGDVVERVAAVVNRRAEVVASGWWLRTNGRLAGAEHAEGDVDPTLARALVRAVHDVVRHELGAAWTSRAFLAASDSMAWELREHTAADRLTSFTQPEPQPTPAPARTLVGRAVPIGPGPLSPTGAAATRRAAIGATATPVTAAPMLRARPIDHAVAAASNVPAASVTASAVLRVPVLAGALVAVLLGSYARLHPPTGQSNWHPFLSRMITFKSWSAAAAFACAAMQVVTGTIVHRRRDARSISSRLADVHRLTGLSAFVLTLPVAFHCLWALGFAPSVGLNRRCVHSVAGCLLYGAYATKVLTVARRGRPRWALPVLGSTLFCAFSLVVASSAGWFFSTQGLQW